jgi:hypothetical protein
VHNCLEGNVEGDTSPGPEETSEGTRRVTAIQILVTYHWEGIFSFATAVTPDPPTQAPETLSIFKSKYLKIWPRAKKTQDEGQGIPIHTHIHRGWDHTNLQWQKVVWPKLDCKLQPLQGESTAAWRLDWRVGERAEGTTMEEPQGQSARSAGSGKGQVVDAECLEVGVKPDKGKAKRLEEVGLAV